MIGGSVLAMMRLSREMDHLFDSFFGNPLGASRLLRRWPFESGGESQNDMSSLWTPSVDVKQKGDSILIHAELPRLGPWRDWVPPRGNLFGNPAGAPQIQELPRHRPRPDPGE